MTRRNEGLYVYALAEAGLPRHLTVLGRRLHSLALGDVDAVIERGGPPVFTTDSVRHQHDIVARLASRHSVILPARFGSTSDEASLRSIVSSRRPEILDAFERVRGCVQMTIRLFGCRGAADDEPRPGARTGTEFLQRARARSRSAPREVEIVRREMPAHVRAERLAVGEREGVMTVFHLVPHPELDAYRRQASGLQSKLARDGIAVMVTGPWPVFAFVPELF
jgi:hypothetical protein